VLAIESSGLHANGFSLVRRILESRGIGYRDSLDDLGPVGEALLEPTRLYTAALLELLAGAHGQAVHALSHVTGGGIAANLARVLPAEAWAEVERSWEPPHVFRVLADLGRLALSEVEGTWNLGAGMLAVVDAAAAPGVQAALAASGLPTHDVGRVSTRSRPSGAFVQGAKGAAGGAVRLTGRWPG
jgi:phosphoribosylformylglycinamidine cyclo-ligase